MAPGARRARGKRASQDASRLVATLIVIGLGTVLAAKVAFRSPNSGLPFYLYGLAVTGVVFTQMLVGLLLYRDPAAGGDEGPDFTDAERGVRSGVLLSDRTSSDSAVSRPLLVSCLVAVHNEEAVIEQCVASLVAQTYRPIEIIIVDDASTDRTPQLLDELAERLPIRVLHLAKNVGKKRALGTALLESSGDVFAFSDSDSTWDPDAVDRCVRVFERHPDVGAVSGHCRALNADETLITRIQDTWYEGQFSVRKAFESYFGAVTCVSGPLAVFRREAVVNFIPAWEQDRFLGQEFRFATDRTMTGYVLMDERRATRLRELSVGSAFGDVQHPWRPWRVVYCKSAKSWTTVPRDFRALLKQQVRWKKSFLRNIFFTGAFYWRRPLPASLTYYLHILFVLAGPLVAFRHLVYLPLHGNIESMVLYVAGILLIGTMFGLGYWREEKTAKHRWFYRPLMSLLSTLVLSWLIGYSLLTIRKMTWSRS